MRADAVDNFCSAYDALAAQRRDDPVWLETLRSGALEAFRESGFPTTRDEAWRYTNTAGLAALSFVEQDLIEQETRAPAFSLPKHYLIPGCDRLVFINGRYSGDLSQVPEALRGSDGGEQGSTGQESWRLSQNLAKNSTTEAHLGRSALHNNQSFAALNLAMMRDGACIIIPRGVELARPLQVIFLARATDGSGVNSEHVNGHGGQPVGSAVYPRHLIVAEEESRATIIETYFAEGSAAQPRFTNVVSEAILGRGASIDHYKIELERKNDFHISLLSVEQAAASTFSSHHFSLSGGLIRNTIRARLLGEGAECTLNGLFIGDGENHIDTQTVIEHIAPRCNSYERYKGVLDERATGVFGGTIHVHPQAQQTDAKQSNQNLLLSKEATVNTKPQLEIFADDVKCTHGATVGNLDSDALFYLRSRGISRADARVLLIRAFVQDLIDGVAFEALKPWLHAEIEENSPLGALK